MKHSDQHFETRVSELKDWTPNPMEGDAIDNFASEVKRAISGIEFGVKSNGSFQAKKFVYMKGHPYVMGYLYHGDPRDSADQHIDHFCVASPRVHNGKYADYNDKRNLKMSVNMMQAVKNAKRYLRPIPWNDVARIDFSTVNREFVNARDKVRQTYYNVKETLGVQQRDTSIMEELSRLIDIGHEFIDKELQSKLVDTLEKRKAYLEDKQKKLNGKFVYAYDKRGVETYIVCDFASCSLRSEREVPHQEYTSDTLPAELKGKVLTLNVLEDRGYVDGVGFKAGDNMFYVTL